MKQFKLHQEKEIANDEVLPTLEIADISTTIEKTSYKLEKVEGKIKKIQKLKKKKSFNQFFRHSCETL
jgi:hypothetical protein